MSNVIEFKPLIKVIIPGDEEDNNEHLDEYSDYGLLISANDDPVKRKEEMKIREDVAECFIVMMEQLSDRGYLDHLLDEDVQMKISYALEIFNAGLLKNCGLDHHMDEYLDKIVMKLRDNQNA